jgi:microsomal epoxide hydrolase
MISTQLGLVDPEHVVGIHLNMVVAPPPPDLDFEHLQEDEQIALGTYEYYGRVDSGYSKIQGTKPQTIGYALDDSPAGLAAWIIEKFRTWSDCDGDVERRFTKDQLLDNVMLYWLTGTAHSAGRLYYEAQQTGTFVADAKVEVPVGVAAFPAEIIRPPRRWAEPRYDIRQWTEMPRGGHFAAFEEPDLLLEDVRNFFRPLRIH